jgi:hypothetical protein
MERIKEYLPSIAMAVAAVVGVFVTASTDGHLTADEVGNLFLATLGAVLTYIVPRFPTVRWLKPAIAVATGVAQYVLSVLNDGISMSEWGMIVLTALGALGVAATNRNVPLYRPELREAA